MSNLNDLFSNDVFAQASANAVSQLPPAFKNTISTTLSTVPYFVPYEDPRVDTYCPMYPCPHKDLFHIARQIDKLPNIKCKYQYDSHTFKVINTERDRTLGTLGKDTIANQVILQCDGYSDRLIRFITLDIDCDLLALIQMERYVRGLYKVNSVE